MKKFFITVYKILPHLTLATAFMLVVLVITDSMNRAMSFLNNPITKVVFVIFLILVLCQSVLTIAFIHKKPSAEEEKH